MAEYAPKYYFFNSRILTHVCFWIVYYIVYSLIWAHNYGIAASFYLELILLPPRMLAVYVTLYWLLPSFLMKQRYIVFLCCLVALLILCAIIQRLFIHFFYEEILVQSDSTLWDLTALLKASLLINTTVLLGLCIKLLGLVEYQKNTQAQTTTIKVKSNRKTYLLDCNNILYIEGLGNYVNYHLMNQEKITSYASIKSTMTLLPKQFLRVHKSYIINKEHIDSFSNEEVEIKGQQIPRSKSITDAELVE